MQRHAITEHAAIVKAQKAIKELDCPICGTHFKKVRWWQAQCSAKCTEKAYKLRVIERLKEEIREEMAAGDHS